MTFPSFITTGGTVDIPTVPLERKALDLTPLIQQLMMNKKSPSTSASKDDKDKKTPDITGTIGQTEQWFDNYQRNQKEIEGLISWYGPELAVRQPEYRRLITEQDNITNPAIVTRLKNNKERLDAYDATVKEKRASGLINMDMLAREGLGLAHSDWSHLMQYAQINEGLQMTNPGSFTWMENFSYTPHIATFNDALDDLYKRYNNIGTSEYTSGGGADDVYQDIKGDFVYLVSEHNSSITTKKSNNNIYGENPTGKGQLDAVKREALKDAFSSFLGSVEGNDMVSGFTNAFLLKTSETVPASKVGLPSNNKVKTIFQQKAYNDIFIEGEPNQNDYLDKQGNLKEEEFKKAYDEWLVKNKEAAQNYYKTHDGYYFKPGTLNENKEDIGGTLDQDALLGDYERFITDIVDAEHEKRLTTVDSYKQDQTKTLTAIDEWQKMRNAEVMVQQEIEMANQEDFSIATEGNLGITEEDFNKLFTEDTGSWYDDLVQNIINPNFSDIMQNYVMQNPNATWDINKNDLSTMEFSSVSPFLISVDKEGVKRYTPNPDWNDESIKIYQHTLTESYKKQGYSETEAATEAANQTSKAIRAHKSLSDNILAKGQSGNIVLDGTKAYVPTNDEDLFARIEKMWFEGTGENKIGKTAAQLFGNQLAQIGLTVGEGANLFGDAFRYVSMEDGFSFQNLGLANNFGAKAKQQIIINGKKYHPGDFIHMSETDQMNPNQLKDFLGKVDLGSNGYWNIENGKAIKNGYPNKKGNLVGSGPNSERIGLELNTTGGANSIAESITSITSNIDLIAKKDDAIKYWKDNQTKLAREVPTYATDPNKKQVFEETEKSYNALRGKKYGYTFITDANRNKYSKEWLQKNDQQFEKWASDLKIDKNNNPQAYAELQKVKNEKDPTKQRIALEEAIAIRDNKGSTKNWDRRKVARYETIIDDNGEVKDFAKQQLYLREEKNSKGDILYKVTTGMEVTAEMGAANPIKAKQRVNTYNNKRYSTYNQNNTTGQKPYQGNPLQNK